MQSFEKNEEGVAVVPAYYSTNHDRKVVDDDKNIISRIKNPNKYAAMIIGALVLVLTFLIVLVILLVKLIRKIRRKITSREKE